MSANEEEIDLVLMVYSDIVKKLSDGRIHVQLPQDVEIVFTLVDGYPENCPPKHQISVPAYLSSLREKLSEQLLSNYESLAGQQVLLMCIGDALNIVNQTQGSEAIASSSAIPDISNDDLSGKISEVDVRPRTKKFHWISGEFLEDRKSIFQAHLINVESKEQALEALAELKQNTKIARATHNIYAYSIRQSNGIEQSDCDDDGEKGAGAKLLHMCRLMRMENQMIVVTRWYGGIQLSTDRFRHICNVARELLVATPNEAGEIKTN